MKLWSGQNWTSQTGSYAYVWSSWLITLIGASLSLSSQ